MDDERAYISDVIKERLAATPDDYYITDNGLALYALIAGVYLWSMAAPAGQNFHKMTEAKIAFLIHEELSKKFG